jgi:hypothetical protein
MFYSAQTGGFYDAMIHGARLVTVPDPAWVRPTVDFVLQPGESAWVGEELVVNTDEEPITIHDVPDMGAIPDTLEVDNPACLIPTDAVAITKERHTELFAGQSNGKRITSDADGYPILVDPPPPSQEYMAAIERVWRDAQLAATDGVVSRHRDELEADTGTTLSVEQYAELQAFRRALRDWPESGAFPLIAQRPQAPECLADRL